MAETLNGTMQPRGGGGLLGHIGRMIIMVCTGGFAFPNAFIEGLDATAIQRQSESKLKS